MNEQDIEQIKHAILAQYPHAVCVEERGWHYIVRSPLQAAFIGSGRTEAHAWRDAETRLSS